MRLKITLKSNKIPFLIPFNYNHILSAIIYNKIADLELAKELHDSISFKFFTFSQINVHERKIGKKGILSIDGYLDFQISSPNDYLIKSLVEGFLNDLTINFNGEQLFIEKIELLKMPEIGEEIKVKTLSPIIVRTKKEVEGKLKIWDLSPADPLFFKNLENNLIKKYNSFNNTEKSFDLNITSEMNLVKRKRIIIEKNNVKTYNRAYNMDLILNGDKEILKFGYNTGLGEKNSIGFGMIMLTI